METDIPSAGEPPLAKICGIQFGLMTSEDIYELSVYSTDEPVTRSKDLCDSRLGLPIIKGTCGTCNAETVDQCQGHFAHCRLPTPIFHPNHVGKLVTLLKKICLNCGQPKTKKISKLLPLVAPTLAPGVLRQWEALANLTPLVTPKVEENFSIPAEPSQHATTSRVPGADEEDDDDGVDYVFNSSSKHKKRKHAELFMDTEARVHEKTAEDAAGVIVLSSDEEDFSSSARDTNLPSAPTVHNVESDGDEDYTLPDTPARRSWNFRKRKSPVESTENNSSTGPATDPAESSNPSAAKLGKRTRAEKGKDSNHIPIDDMFAAKPARENRKPARGKCKYCSGAHPDRYPEVLLKVEVKERGKDDSLSKAIKMEYKVKEEDIDCVATDYWGFVEKNSQRRQSSSVKKTRLLLPSEALKILKKIPESALLRLGMHPIVALPEALIIECVPVPPNCSRIQDDAFGSSNIQFRHGTDRATAIFSKLLNKINGIRTSRYGKPSFFAAVVESSELQSLFGLYLREKGAAKAVPGKEKKKIDHSGRLQKRDPRWSLEWLKTHVLGKRSGYCARTVVTGDPYLKIEEIGIPQQIAKYVTIPERVNRLNQEKLQDCINVGQSLVGRYRACGAVRLTRGNERLEVTRKTSHDLQIGDVVHRHLRDGDLVYVNRNPSLNKHSLIAQRVLVQDNSVFTINPAVCAPLGADFDGDCLHVFVPQSEEAKAEVQLLMTIPEQLLPPLEGKTIIGMSQDNILATHLLTSSPVFLNKEEMHQMGMWSTRILPIPAIVKSKKGPMWTGKQVIDLSIPEGFSSMSKDGAVDIRDGELVSYRGKGNWLTSTAGLMHTLARHSPLEAVRHLDCSQSALREWLISRGFSVSLGDFYACSDHQARRKLIDDLIDSMTEAQNMAVNRELLFDEQFQKLEAIQPDIDVSQDDPKQAEVLEDIAVGFFRQHFSEIEKALGLEISDENQLLAMVRSGSKGSLSKVIQQIGSLGLQLYKGEHLLTLENNFKLLSLATSLGCSDRWEARGLVRSSLLDGLDPLEFYLHSIAVRASLVVKRQDVTKSGDLFKRLMLFLRDIYVSYDGTVRNKCGTEIIQFSYDAGRRSKSEDGLAEDKEDEECVIPGEPVGALAATAIAEPAYQVMLESNHNVGSKKIRPLELLQDSIFPRSGTKLKASDRRSTLRLEPCPCEVRHCDERRALHIKNELQPFSVEMLASATIIEYVPEGSLEYNACRDQGVKLRLPWVGHIRLDANAMMQIGLNMETVVSAMDTAFTTKGYAKVMRSHYLGTPVFFSRNDCNCGGAGGNNAESGPCLHFSAALKSKSTKRLASRTNKKVMEFLDALRDVMMPLILETIVKGDKRMASVSIVWEDAAWSPCIVLDSGERIPSNPNGELVIEVVVQEKISPARGSPWSIIKEACALLDGIDWRRSSPYSIQEVRHAFGVEAARDCILQRMTLATQAAGTPISSAHLTLVADTMAHSGEVNGITYFGYRDLLRSLKTSAPFTSGAFRAPIKTFMEAGEKGDEEVLSGVLASSIFGKMVPLGTGADFSLQLHPKDESEKLQVPVQSADLFDCLSNLNTTIKANFPASPVDVPVTADDPYAYTQDANEWGAPAGDAGQWGSPAPAGASSGAKVSDDGGAWGEPSSAPANDTDAGGWGDPSPPQAADKSAGGWGDPSPPQAADKSAGGWGDPSPQAADKGAGGWGDPSPPSTNVGVASPAKDTGGGGWDAPNASGMEEAGARGAENVPASDGQAEAAPAANDWDTEMATEKEDTDSGWGAAEETPAASSAWGEEPAPAAEGAGGWGSPAVAHTPRADFSSHRSSRRDRDEPTEVFVPTGANIIPLGRMRQFGPKAVGAGSGSASPSATPMALDPPVVNNGSGTADTVKDGEGGDEWSKPAEETQEANWGGQEEVLEANWGSAPAADGNGKDAVADWGLQPLKESSGWATLDTTQASTGGLESPAVHSTPVHSTPGWSPRWSQDTTGRYGQSSRGFSTPRRALDSRKDLEEWKMIIDIVRSVREILQTYKPEEKLKEEDHHVLMTQVLPHHPSSATKIGCGVDYFKVAHYKTTRPTDRPTKCFFLVRTDGTQEDFSYHKCLQTLASKNDPPLGDLYATAFIQRK